MHSNNNTHPGNSYDSICQIFEDRGKDAAVLEYQRLLIIRIKLEIIKLLKWFYKDQSEDTMTNMNTYCKNQGIEFLDCLEEYWKLMKEKVFVRDNGWKVPTVLILGKTGTGKSSLCNVIAGKWSESNMNCGGFPVSAKPDACTKNTTAGDFCYFGNVFQPVTVLDTPGFDDPKSSNKDAETIADLVEKLQQMKVVHQILIAVNGTDPRLDGAMRAMIDIFRKMFTPKIWENIGVVFTKLIMDDKTIRKRQRHTDKTDAERANEYVDKIRTMFDVPSDKQLDTFFLDTNFDIEDPEEVNAFTREKEAFGGTYCIVTRYLGNNQLNIF